MLKRMTAAAFAVLAGDEQFRFRAREPAAAFQFRRIDFIVIVLDFAEHANHQ